MDFQMLWGIKLLPIFLFFLYILHKKKPNVYEAKFIFSFKVLAVTFIISVLAMFFSMWIVGDDDFPKLRMFLIKLGIFEVNEAISKIQNIEILLLHYLSSCFLICVSLRFIFNKRCLLTVFILSLLSALMWQISVHCVALIVLGFNYYILGESLL